MNVSVGTQYVYKCLGESEMDIVMRAKVTGDCDIGMSESRERNGFLCSTGARCFICIVDSRGRDVVVDRCEEQEDKEKNNREPYNLSPPCTGRTTNCRRDWVVVVHWGLMEGSEKKGGGGGAAIVAGS